MRLGSLLVLFAIAGCSDGSKDDGDGDGYGVDVDCDDADPAINPTAVEACDGIDNNCNGEIDELVAIEMYPDDDGDGFGDGVTEVVCSGTVGYSRADGDCDDSDDTVNPDATEDCDPVDRDCDGDPTAGATDFPTFYFDSDRDTWGEEENTLTSACTAPVGWATRPDDCDDTEDSINPGADEVCNGADDDCDGGVDVGATDGTLLYADTDGDTYGDPSSGTVTCAANGLVTNDLDCDDTDRAVRPGATEVCNAVDDDCDPATDEDQVAGTTWYSDVDGDGLGDASATLQACTQPANAVAVSGDCDDADDTVLAGPSWYDDNDLDGFGDPDTFVAACSQPQVGFVNQGGDCNDNSNVSYPGADEICDTLDNDCDTVADNNAVDAVTFYTDTDFDLFGDPALPVVACTQPSDASAAGTDCDDSDPTSFPGNIEICDGGVDNDCDPSSDEAVTAVNYRDADGDGYGTDQDSVFGCSPPVGYVTVSGDCDDTDDTVNPLATPNCTRSHCGTIALSETWSPPLRHLVTCDVSVQGAARPTLTITAGTQVEFAANTGIKVADTSDGRLLVTGDALVPVRFTSTQAVKNPGQWDGIWILGRDTGSQLEHLIVEAAGASAPTSSNPGGVVFTGADVFVDDLRADGNLGAGLVVNAGAEPLVVRSSFTNNTGNGLYVAVGGGLSRLDEAGTQGPSFQDNVLTDNGARPVTVPGSHADEIELSNTVSPNATEEIELLSGVLRFAGTWYDHALPYVVAASALIEVEDGPQAELTVDDDVEIYFNAGAELTIGVDAGGALYTGTNTLFTGTPTVIANSLNWRGVTLGANDLGSVIGDLEIAYGGANTKGNLFVNNSSPTIQRMYSHHSDNAGVYVAGALAAPLIRDSDITDNDTDGVFVESTSGVARDSLGPTFVGNLLTRNGLSSVVFPPNFLGELDPSTTFVGNGDRVGVHGGTVLDDATWRELDEDYEVRGDVFIGGPRDPVVDVQDAVTIFFDRNASLRAGTVDDGVLRVNGDTNGVLFTSSDPAPGKGDWEGVMLGGATTPDLQIPDHRLANLTIRYAGGSDVAAGGAIEMVERSLCLPSQRLFVENVSVLDSTKAAFYAKITADVNFDGFTTDGESDWAFFFDPGSPLFPCTYNIGSAGDDVAKGLDITGDFNGWPSYELVDLADPSNTFTTSPVVYDTTITADTTWPLLGVPIVVDSNIQLGSGAAPQLDIATGNTIRFRADAGIVCGSSGQGSLFANNVTFTSDVVPANPGDWRGVEFGTGCATRIVDSLFEYAGANGFGTLYNPGGSCCGQNPSINAFLVGSYLLGNTVKDSSSCGMYNIDDPDANRDGLLDANGLTWPPYFAPLGSLFEFETVFTGSIGGLGNHCP